MNDDNHLRYPIGRQEDQPYYNEENFSEKIRDTFLREIKILPSLLEHAIINLDADQLNTPYRPGGWTVQQVVHHVPDSHMHAYIRFKLALTENNPTIKPYDEAAWALLNDSFSVPVNISLTLLHALHARWFNLLQGLQEADWKRTIYHPGHKRAFTLWSLLASYAWHGKHHVAHITSLRERMDWR
jgi:hypothetical protein